MKDTWPVKSSPSAFPHRLFKVRRWGGGSDRLPIDDKLEEVTDMDQADLISSQIEDSKMHTIMLDLDVPARLIPSSTEGHSHLYIDVKVCWPRYRKLLDALAEAGVLQEAYVEHSKRKGFTALRLPWVKKEIKRPEAPTGYWPIPLGIDAETFEKELREAMDYSGMGRMPPPAVRRESFPEVEWVKVDRGEIKKRRRKAKA
jgi:hypothetical protein